LWPRIGASPHRRLPLVEVRKTVTVLFADVMGSTALGEHLDPESMRGVMARYFDEMRSAIEAHGGTVEKFIGDAVMAVFGVPMVHEDDALRAVRAATQMREILETLNAELDRGSTPVRWWRGTRREVSRS
jgi:class 3 adenylate cyclase